MTVDTGGRYVHAAQRRMTMNTAAIHFHRFIKRNIVFGGQVDILMTPATGFRKISWTNARTTVVDSQDIMLAVAITAGWNITVFANQRAAMADIRLDYVLMAKAAIDRRNNIIMRKFFDCVVTIQAFDVFVNGLLQQTVVGRPPFPELYGIDRSGPSALP